jgi:hypothetical protein
VLTEAAMKGETVVLAKKAYLFQSRMTKLSSEAIVP